MQISRAYACELLMNATIFPKKGMFFGAVIVESGVGYWVSGAGTRV